MEEAFYAAPEFADDYSPEVVRADFARGLKIRLQTLSDFARTAPGRLPSAVQDALLPPMTEQLVALQTAANKRKARKARLSAKADLAADISGRPAGTLSYQGMSTITDAPAGFFNYQASAEDTEVVSIGFKTREGFLFNLSGDTLVLHPNLIVFPLKALIINR
jgi:hypothetical protein